ncbi:hypothetical protein EJB05_27014, partial [Eragrostis curvula]
MGHTKKSRGGPGNPCLGQISAAPASSAITAAAVHRPRAASPCPGNPCLGRIYAVPASSAIPTAPSSVSAVHVEVVFHEALRLPPNSSRLLDAVYPGLLAAGAVHVELPLRLLLPELLRHASQLAVGMVQLHELPQLFQLQLPAASFFLLSLNS